MRFLNWLALIITSFTSSKRLRPYEDAILNGWRKSLESEVRLILDNQLKRVKFVQRQAADSKVVFYYKNVTEDCLFSNLSPDLHAASVIIGLPFEKSDRNILKSDIFLHRGKLSSIEFSEGFIDAIDPAFFESDNFDIISVASYSSL